MSTPHGQLKVSVSAYNLLVNVSPICQDFLILLPRPGRDPGFTPSADKVPRRETGVPKLVCVSVFVR